MNILKTLLWLSPTLLTFGYHFYNKYQLKYIEKINNKAKHYYADFLLLNVELIANSDIETEFLQIADFTHYEDKSILALTCKIPEEEIDGVLKRFGVTREKDEKDWTFIIEDGYLYEKFIDRKNKMWIWGMQ